MLGFRFEFAQLDVFQRISGFGDSTMNFRCFSVAASLLFFLPVHLKAMDYGEREKYPGYNEPPRGSQHKKVVSSWLGADINELIAGWGPPSGQYTMPNGNVIYTWDNRALTTTPMTIDRSAESSDSYNVYGGTYESFCTTSFTTDRSGKIVDWRFNGNAC
jgi:hypothetical protein